MSELVTILTPTYNRKKQLYNLFESLNKQINKNFIWLIVDDGSTDGTEKIISDLKNRAEYKIEYISKSNGGKHTALNIGFQQVSTKLVFIVDSDDILIENAVQKIYDNSYELEKNNLAGISFLRGYDENKIIGDVFPTKKSIYNGIDIQFRYKITGDKAEVWRSDILKQYQFPVFDGEKFQGENYIWWQIARRYNMLYVNEIIYITKYLDGGLTLSGKKMRIKNPKGGMENSRQAFYKEFPLKTRLKYSWLYDCYAFFDNKKPSEAIKESGNKFMTAMMMPLGYLLYKYWNVKYGD